MKKILILLMLVSHVLMGQNLVRMATASGTNTYSATFNPAVTAFSQTTVYVVTFTNANSSTTVTFDPDGGDALTAKAVKDNAGNDPAVGSIKAGGTYSLKYNGTNFRVIESVTAGAGGVTSVSGTTNRITSTGGLTPVIDVSATFEALLGKVAQRIDQNNASTTSAQLATTLSDEVGSGGGFLRATAPTMSDPVVGTQAVADNSTKAASTAYVDRVDGTKLNKNFDYVVKTSNYTPGATDTLTNRVFLMHSTGSLTFTIPAAATFNFKKGTTFMVIGDSTGTTTIAKENGSLQFESSGTAPFTLTGDQYALVSKRNTTNTWDIFIGSSGTSMTNPMTTAADIIVGGASGTPARLAKGTGLQYLRMNSGATAQEWATLSAGITLTAVNNSIPKSDGTNLVESGLSVPTAGDLNMGLTGTGGTARTFTATGSGSNIDLIFVSKGSSSVFFTTPNTYFNGTTNFYLYGASNPTMWLGQPGTTNANVRGYPGQSGNIDGVPLTIAGGAGYTTSGNGNGGALLLQSGQRRTAGSGTDGVLTLDPLTSWIEIPNASNTPGTMTNKIGLFSQDVSSSAELLVKNEAGIVTQISGQQIKVLNKDVSTVGNVTTGEDQLYSYTLPASTMSVNGNTVIITAEGTRTANANAKTVKVKFGATVVSAVALSGTWKVECSFTRTGAATQKGFCYTSEASTGTVIQSGLLSPTETLSGTIAIVVTGEATATNDIVKESVKVIFEP